MISQELLLELKTILKEEFGLDLALKDVAKFGNDLIGYFDLLIKINFQKGGDIYENK